MEIAPDDIPDSTVKIIINPESDRIQRLEPFPAWSGSDFIQMPILIKVSGKCTTDHISMAGPWLKYRGHLPNISQNMLLGAINASTGKEGVVLDGEVVEPHVAASAYKDAGSNWCVVGEENYGEGSSREHAAMSPRYLGGLFVLVKSFARIHEANLKKQGMLPLTFTNKTDYNLIGDGDTISVVGLNEITPEVSLLAIIHHVNGESTEITVNHTFSEDEIAWFKAGSALNYLRD
jgi:aconitate hydratase